MRKRTLLLLIPLFFVGCNTQLPQTAHDAVVDAGDDHDHGVSLADPEAVRGFFGDGVAELDSDEPFEQVGFMLTASAPPVLEYRTARGNWQPVQLTWSEVPFYNARIILQEPVTRLELRGGEGIDALSLEFFATAVSDPTRLARSLPLESAPHGLERQTAPSSLVVSRYGWGARDPGKVCGDVHTPYRMAIHHTAGNNGQTNPAAVMRQIQAYHIDTNGWCDIGYHFVVSADGTVFQGRSDERRTGAHVSGQNTGNIGVALMGNYISVAPPDAQLSGAVEIVGWIGRAYGISLDRNRVKGHKEWAPGTTSCPGTELLNRIPTILARAGGTPPPTTCTRSWPSVQRSTSYSKNAKVVQYLLRAHGYSLTADGYFGAGTYNAVVSFQQSRGLADDGVVGKNTWEKLVAGRTVAEGDRGDAVRAVQTLLGVSVDGVFGSQTKSAVISFQRSKGLPADGVVGANTWAALVGGKGCP